LGLDAVAWPETTLSNRSTVIKRCFRRMMEADKRRSLRREMLGVSRLLLGSLAAARRTRKRL